MKPALKKRLLRTAILSAVALVIGGGMALVQIKNQSAVVVQRPTSGRAIQGSDVGGAYELVDQNGKTVTDKDFADRYKLLYFGFTYCPAICPTELQKISQALNILGTKGDKIQPLFITIDPERDTVAALHDYVAMFHPRMIGLTGNRAQIDSVLKTYRVYARKVQEENMSDYTMDHSSFIYLMSPEDELIAIYRTEDNADFIAGDIKEIIQ